MLTFNAVLYRNGILTQETVKIQDSKKESKKYLTRMAYLDAKISQVLGVNPICYSQIL